jgi:hypothetical protein
VRRAEANLVRGTSHLAAALRRSREAVSAIEGELDALLSRLRDPQGVPDAGAPDRLRRATREAGAVVASLGALGQALAPRR